MMPFATWTAVEMKAPSGAPLNGSRWSVNGVFPSCSAAQYCRMLFVSSFGPRRTAFPRWGRNPWNQNAVNPRKATNAIASRTRRRLQAILRYRGMPVVVSVGHVDASATASQLSRVCRPASGGSGLLRDAYGMSDARDNRLREHSPEHELVPDQEHRRKNHVDGDQFPSRAMDEQE